MTGMLRTILLGFIFATLAVPAPAAELRAGRAAVDITPPRGMPMAGYYYVRLNEGTHDPLQAKALVLEKDGTKAAMVALDVGNIARHIVEAAREHIGKMTAVPGANVMISATRSPAVRRR